MNLGISDAVTDRENQEYFVEAAVSGFLGYGIASWSSLNGPRQIFGFSSAYTYAMVAAGLATFLLQNYAQESRKLSESQSRSIHFASGFLTGGVTVLTFSNPMNAALALKAGFLFTLGTSFASPISNAVVSLIRAPFIDAIENDDDEDLMMPSELNPVPQAAPFQVINPDSINVNFKDVAGIDQAKEDVQEVVDFLKNSKRYTAIGAEIPRGILLYGPPGTGKTMLGKATAKEANVPFYYVSGSQIQGVYVGVGAINIRRLFQAATKNSPCIIYIDEIDALTAARGSKAGDHKDDFLTITELLTQMDGFAPNNGVVVMAATNKPEVIDPAIMRAGRFDRKVPVDLPNQKGRQEILEVHAKKIRLHSDVSLKTIAKRTQGASGAELKNMLNEAALMAVKENALRVSMKHMLEAVDKVRFGKIVDHEQDSNEIKATAYHEAGHTLVALMLKDANPVEKVTILPRSNYLGVTIFENDKKSSWKKNLVAQMATAMGGRVAEEVFLGDLSAGASSDLRQAHYIAKQMTRKLGMTQAGPISISMYDDEAPMQIRDIEKKLLLEAEKTARNIIEKNKDVMHLIAEGLIKYETLMKEDLDYILEHKKLPNKSE